MIKTFIKQHRRLCHVLLTVGVILLALALNLLLPLWQYAGAVYLDLTPEGLYSVSSQMEKQMEAIKGEIEVIFCADRDHLMASTETRHAYVLAEKLAKKYDNITVRTIDVTNHPELADPYRTTRLEEILWSDLIITYGGQIRGMSARQLWSEEEGVLTKFNGEYKLASAMLSLVAYENAPLAVFTKGHGETYYDPADPDRKENEKLSAFAGLLENLGLRIGTVDLDKEEIPSDCVLLIMNGPTEDYSAGNILDLGDISPMEKIDRYLAGHQAFWALKDPAAGELPVLNGFLEEWGLSFRADVVKDASAGGALNVVGGNAEDEREYLIATYATEAEGTLGYLMYQDIADLSTAPKTILETSSSVDLLWGDLGERVLGYNVTRCVSGVFFSGEKAKSYNMAGERNVLLSAPFPLMAVSTELRMGQAVDYYSSYVLATGTTRILANEYLESTSCCNYDTVYSILQTVSNTDRYADPDLGALTMNSARYGGKTLWKEALYEEDTQDYMGDEEYLSDFVALTSGKKVAWTVTILVFPCLIIPAVGIILHRRRRFR